MAREFEHAPLETEYNGALYRSRLEARWAAMFDLLGISFTYEPMEFNGYIPDFVLIGPRPVLVEVRPCLVKADYWAVAKEMQERVGFVFGCRKGELGAPRSPWPHDMLVLGTNALADVEGGRVWEMAGLLGEYKGHDEREVDYCDCLACVRERFPGFAPEPPWVAGSAWLWGSSQWMRCSQCPATQSHVGFTHDEGWFVCRPCGEYDSGKPEPEPGFIAYHWSQAHRKTRWEPKKQGPWGR